MGRISRTREKLGKAAASRKEKAERRIKRGLWKRFKKYLKLYIEFRIFTTIVGKFKKKLRKLWRRDE